MGGEEERREREGGEGKEGGEREGEGVGEREGEIGEGGERERGKKRKAIGGGRGECWREGGRGRGGGGKRAREEREIAIYRPAYMYFKELTSCTLLDLCPLCCHTLLPFHTDTRNWRPPKLEAAEFRITPLGGSIGSGGGSGGDPTGS